jgi:hypothetical protein
MVLLFCSSWYICQPGKRRKSEKRNEAKRKRRKRVNSPGGSTGLEVLRETKHLHH